MNLSIELQSVNKLEVFKFLSQEWAPHLCLIDGTLINVKDFSEAFPQPTPYKCIVITTELDLKKQRQFYHLGADHCLTADQAEFFLKEIILNLQVKSSIEGNERLKESDQFITWSNLKIYPEDHLVKMNDKIINISPVQFKLILSLVKNNDQLLTRKWLQQYVWRGAEISPRSIDAQISKLKKLIPIFNDHLHNIYGQGYLLSNSKKFAA